MDAGQVSAHFFINKHRKVLERLIGRSVAKLIMRCKRCNLRSIESISQTLEKLYVNT
ncbi:hypothetical protein APHCRT_0926 [Anaplasma phagocytophilum str. CRT53-1]|uniref:Uncharacterized protein n=3 Tax=Anaplasma phagocytophilum TaxID=948 RepID=Q2GJS5_ANAPZ|nr:hypothetical protein APH_0799 [Anaplasma phagocytophilum str. HZ]KJV60589.1 hypothetical protein APHWEB_1219 [Anaplasma phagocytophilum str. Webster]KJV82793.1 hypothetical protein APHHGE2_1094 [Anaplasma phagocytophilum str. HGE2]KJV85140.1 hypothetical protein APHWI1_0296 [Anaplasma phagocytophilum str. ApWI1]KJV85753.1 hypothetical protein APHCRT_0926 [Anaplasma phagocytophilum str. CRT53-1]KJV87253.1 hypothetical protein APHNYW_0808 [Anaplasma phagocytophilum str. ApNYW]KJV98656.1 hypo